VEKWKMTTNVIDRHHPHPKIHVIDAHQDEKQRASCLEKRSEYEEKETSSLRREAVRREK
tara:strand:- start:10452 stop:10631 length:180 start_codon:yes stop_codon:yes gene_type:complete